MIEIKESLPIIAKINENKKINIETKNLPKIQVQFQNFEQKISLTFQKNNNIIAKIQNISINSKDFEIYKGKYTIIPKSW